MSTITCHGIILNTCKVTQACHFECEDDHSIKSWYYMIHEPHVPITIGHGIPPLTNNVIEDSILILTIFNLFPVKMSFYDNAMYVHG